MTNKTPFILLVLISFFTVKAQQSGEIYSYEKKLDLTPSGVLDFIDECSNEDTPSDLLIHVRNFRIGLEAYKLTYYTKDYNDNLVKATGLVMFPKTYKKLSTILYCHATTNNRDNVPSNLKDTFGIGFVLPLTYALNEYIVVAPDFYGMGDGDGTQNYVEAKTTADSSLDMLKAANTFLDEKGMERYDENFLTGYSLGGHAGMATLKKATEDNLYRFKHAYLGAGPHDLSYATLQTGVIEKTIYPISAFLANAMYTCDKIGYSVKENNWNEVIAEPYLDAFTKSTINDEGGLLWGPIIWRNLFTSKVVNAITNDNQHPIRKCLRASDVYDWYNTTPTTLTDGILDNIIPPKNNKVTVRAQHAYYPWWSLKKYQIARKPVGLFGHVTGILPWILGSVNKFNSLRKGGFFNLRAERLGNKQQKPSFPTITMQQSSIQPVLHINGKKESFKLKEITNYKAKQQKKKSQKEGVYLAEASINGITKNFPLVIEKPVDLSFDDVVIQENKDTWKLDLKDIENEVTFVRLFDANNQMKKELKAPFTLTKKDIETHATLEIGTGHTFFAINLKNAKSVSTIGMHTQENILFVNAPFAIQNIVVYDLSGKQIARVNQIDANQYTIPLNDGFYIVHLTDKNGNVHTQKIIM